MKRPYRDRHINFNKFRSNGPTETVASVASVQYELLKY